MATALYIISDLHFDDQWICDELRPFDDVDEMNESLRSNCKAQIDDGDPLLFLGDLVGKDATDEDVWYWYGELTEIDCWIPGDHDHVARSGYEETPLPVRPPFQKEVDGQSFRFKHKPHREKEGDHWVIHRHKHNEKPEKYPFISLETRRINVSASMVRYVPISMRQIVELIETGQRCKLGPKNR